MYVVENWIRAMYCRPTAAVKTNGIKSNPFELYRCTTSTAPFNWKSKGIKYLGIKIQAPIYKKVELNAPDLLKTMREDAKRWPVLPVSLWGRSEIIKMSSMPLMFHPNWFKEINKILSEFLWNYKKPRISQKKIINSRSSGGIGLTDIYQYYIAFISRYLLQWAYNTERHLEDGNGFRNS